MNRALRLILIGFTTISVKSGAVAQFVGFGIEPQGGNYHIANEFSQKCVSFHRAGGLVANFADNQPCNPASLLRNPLNIVLSGGSGTFNIRTVDKTLCATVARGVVGIPGFSDPRIDFLPCDGQADQAFTFVLADSSSTGVDARFLIRTTAGKCWSNTDSDFHVVDCNNQDAHLRFRLQLVSGLNPADAMAEANAGALQLPGCRTRPVTFSPFMVSTNFFLHDMSPGIPGLFDPSSCMFRCFNTCGCVGYSWVVPGVQGDRPMCWLKSSLPPSNPDSNVVSGTIR